MRQNLLLSHSFEIKPSQQHEKLLNLLHGIAILACVLNSLEVADKAALICLIVVLRIMFNGHRQSGMYQLRFTDFSGWEMAFENDDYSQVTISGSTVVTAFAIFLQCKMQNQAAKTLVIAKDSLSKNDFRRLIVRLRLSGYEQAS